MKTAAVLSAITAVASAHATWQQLWKNGKDLESTCARLPPSNSPVESYTGTALQCNVNPAAAQGKCDFEAGDTVTIEMHQHNSRDCTEQAIGGAHWGPVLAYMSKVEDASTADGSSEFFKVYQNTWAKNPAATQGDNDFWGTKDLNYNCGKLDFTIPKDIAPGDYLLRAEAIALHAAGPSGGAQHYMTCYQLTVTGSGTLEPKGVKFPEAYIASGPGLGFSIHADLDSYPAPGPALIASGTEAKPQLLDFGKISGAPAAPAPGSASKTSAASTVAPSSTSAAVEAAPSSATPAEASSSPAATSAMSTSEPAPISSEVAPTQTPQLSSVAPYPVANSTSTMLPGTATLSTMITAVRPSATSEPSGPIKEYYQCGGINYKGAGQCASGLECKQWNPYYFQCVKPEANQPGPSKGPMPSPSPVAPKPTPSPEAPASTSTAPVAAEPVSATPVAIQPSYPAASPAPIAGVPASGKPSSGKPSSGKPSSSAPASGAPSSGSPGAGAGEKKYTLETFITMLEKEAGSETAAKMRRMIDALL
ncbi:endo-beta-14-glucanase D [Pyrenophora tritici-repentis]|uniref:AA9 family lytic polysaccharide monooxygenase n=1 Tax=Pyrenophora tritici-repentis TaxID=45151 RepID=A0A921PII6_9PLEO|nr:endo-beta-1-4-glucanase D [Pyrenophora tritici-repentis]KAI1519975.1 endo-beta-1,4-glucanase D [Pyrenophora tritici-repentis]KAI1539490.1 endo-beta-14-glucanase D [Pyrenophora tritici-repentis]KAI1542085.1 endo-beta-14-glucanase D [Pyrenophora tritici-repentis]KAI1553552.1 endo-beta-14-glucanase D [Pyrenophora tritici-repentis]